MEQYNNKATASLVLGIISLVCIWFGYSALIGIVCAIVGLVFAVQIRKASQEEGFTPSAMAKFSVSLAWHYALSALSSV